MEIRSEPPRLFRHLDQNISRLCRTAHFPQECDAGSTSTILRFQAYVESQRYVTSITSKPSWCDPSLAEAIMEKLPQQARLASIADILQRLIRIENDILQIVRASGQNNRLGIYEAQTLVREAIQALKRKDAPNAAG